MFVLGDKNFITNEYHELSRMAEENLKPKLRDQNRKRRRTSTSEVHREIDDDSSLSAWSGVSQNVTTERVLSPSAHVQQMTSRNNVRYVPPMSFDQGCQTDTRMTGETNALQGSMQELQRLIELNQLMLSEQKLLKNEVKMNRSIVDSFFNEFAAMRTSMKAIEEKIDVLSEQRAQFEAIEEDQQMGHEKKKILNGSTTQPYTYIIESQEGGASGNASLSLTGSNLEYTVEELDADDSGRSTSRMSYHDQTSMMSNSSIDYPVSKKENFRRSHSSSNFSIHSASSTPILRDANAQHIEEWADVQGEVELGSNKTMIGVHELRSIDWKNYKTATRKLLTRLFARETLASRSLTGRPSPAFHDRNKPIKEKLDQNIINDIIQIVTRKCGVQESQVRTAITTKCADENKMMRNRKKDEGKFKTPTSAEGTNGSGQTVENKENIVKN